MSSGCNGGSDCKKRYLVLDENITTTKNMIIGSAPAKSEFGGFEMVAEEAEENDGSLSGSSSGRVKINAI